MLPHHAPQTHYCRFIQSSRFKYQRCLADIFVVQHDVFQPLKRSSQSSKPRRKSYFSASFGITLGVLAFAYSVVLCAHLSFGVRVCVCARSTKVAHMPQFCDLFRSRREQRPDKWVEGCWVSKMSHHQYPTTETPAAASAGHQWPLVEIMRTCSGLLNPNYGRLSGAGSRMTFVIIWRHILLK